MAIGWGIVGLGRSADAMIAPAIALDPHGELVAAVSRDRTRAELFAAKHGVESAGTDYEAMLSNPHVDAVFITTPNALHVDQVILAARAGKHVICDKPLALHAEDAERALSSCADAGVQLGVMFESRQMACFREARDLVLAGELGDVSLVQFDVSSGRGSHNGWRADPAVAGLGAVFNIGVHPYDLLRFVLDAEVTEVTAMFDTGRSPGLEMVAIALMRLSNGTIAFVNANEVTPLPLNEVVILGTRGRLDGRGITSPGRDGDMRVSTATGERVGSYTGGDCWERTVSAFSKALIDGTPVSPSGVDGLRSVELTDAIAMSARLGITVALNQ
jgi:1,5-anhydro-D-fructose reductase (1,5-anhydro-D-mannitol-forming)